MILSLSLLVLTILGQKIEYSQLSYGLLEASHLVDKVSITRCKNPLSRERPTINFDTFIQDTISLSISCKWKSAADSLERFKKDRVLFNKAAQEFSSFLLTVLDQSPNKMKNDGLAIGQILESHLASASPYVLKFRFIGEEIMNHTEKAYPIAVFHGLGDSCNFPGVSEFTRYLGKELNTLSRCIEIGDGPTASWLMSLNLQLDNACESLKKIPEFNKGVNLVGLSQGGLLVRVLAQSCNLSIKSVISIGGPQMGLSTMPKCVTGYFCDIYQDAINMGIYEKVPQLHIGPPGYYKDPKEFEKFVDKSGFLSKYNNEKTLNKTLIENLQKIEKLVLVLFAQDSVTDPKETQHFSFYANGSKSTILPYNKTNDYINDLIGLRTLDLQHKLIRESIEADHLQLTSQALQQSIIPHLLS